MKLHAYEVDGHDFYWEIYFETGTYYATVESEDMGDLIAKETAKGNEVIIFSQEPYQVMFALHIELDKFFGNETYPLEDCDAIHDPTEPFDYWCEGCKAYQKFTENKFYGDFYNNPSLWKKNLFLHNDVELVANV